VINYSNGSALVVWDGDRRGSRRAEQGVSIGVARWVGAESAACVV